MSTLGQALALPARTRDGLSVIMSAFSRRTRERGADYVRRGRVESLALRDDAIEATVRGSDDYRVIWQPEKRGDRTVWVARCSCPIGTFCKHAYAVAALLLGEAAPGADPSAGAAAAEVEHDPEAPDEVDDRTVVFGRALSGHGRPSSPKERERTDRLALRVLRESVHGWERRAAADRIVERSGLAYDDVHRVVSAARLDGSDPDVRCWRLATEVARVAGRGAVPPVLAPFLDRPDLEQLVLDRERERLRRDLLVWMGRARGAKAGRALRALVGLRTLVGGAVIAEVELRVTSSRGELPQSAAQLRQLHGELLDDPRALAPEQAEVLAIVVDRLDASPGTARGHVAVALPLGPLRHLLERGVQAGLVFWSDAIDRELARRGGIVAGAPVRLGDGTAEVAPLCRSDGDDAALELGVTWSDGRSVDFADAVVVQAQEPWRGARQGGLVVTGGEVFPLAALPPDGLVDRFRKAGGRLPLGRDERVSLVARLAERWPHLRATLAAHTELVPVEPVVTLDLREDDWLQIRLLARRTTEPPPDDAGTGGFELTPDETWAPLPVVDPAAAGVVPIGAAPQPAVDDGRDAGPASAAPALAPGSPSNEAAGEPPRAAPWLVLPEPAQVAPATAWLRATGAIPGGRRGPRGVEPPWPDRTTGFWLRVTSRRVAAFFAEWERRPTAVTYLGNERARRLLGPTSRALPRVRVEASGVDFLQVSAAWETEAAGLTEEEIAELRSATQRFVRLPSGWARKPDPADDAAERALADLGIDVDAGIPRLTLWQLAGARSESLDALAALGADPETLQAVGELRARVARFAGLPRITPPRTLRAKLRPYQRDGLDFLAFTADLGGGAILADDMGLGKTVQTLAWLEHLRRVDPGGGPALVVCPASVVHNWRREAERFAPSLRVLVLERGDERHALRAEVARHDLVITNYALLRRDAAAWRTTELRAAILDEAQNVKNPDAAVTRAAHGLRARHRLALTGTLLENRPLDLFSIVSFVNPGYLGTRAQFVALFDHPDLPAARRVLLAAKLRPLLLRRLKRDVAQDLPERIEERRDAELTSGQRRLYLAELAKSRDLVARLGEEADGLRKNRITILAALTRLRQICCHPALAGGKEELGSGKVAALFEVLEPLVAEGHKVLVFSQFVALLAILERELAARGIAHHVLTGETVNREAVLQRFADDPRPAVFLLSLKAGGTGLNLTAASYVVLFDPWWNPAVEAQAIDRSHRIGQDRTVIAYRLIARDTIEERIAELQARKASLVRELLGDGTGAARALTREDLEFLLAPIEE